ncbi:MAG: heparin lyase I family protein [Bdellovibrionales bacterium]|nr:heparin lyase I family protein [Bdellovibrionales bacterium]
MKNILKLQAWPIVFISLAINLVGCDNGFDVDQELDLDSLEFDLELEKASIQSADNSNISDGYYEGEDVSLKAIVNNPKNFRSVNGYIWMKSAKSTGPWQTLSGEAKNTLTLRAVTIKNDQAYYRAQIRLTRLDGSSATQTTTPVYVKIIKSSPVITSPAPAPTPTTQPNQGRKGIIYFSGAETGAIQAGSKNVDGWGTELNSRYVAESAKVVSNVSRAGKNSIRMFYDKSWGVWAESGKIRSELKAPGGNQLKLGQEYWISFSIYMADNTNNRNVINTKLVNSHCIQWHYVGSSGTSGINMRNGNWNISFGTVKERSVKPIQLGKWTDFVYHVKLSSGSDGFVKVWINKSATDTPDMSVVGPTATSDLNPKMGIYRGAFDTDYVEIFYDEYRIGDKTSSFNDIFPDFR